MPLVGPLWVLQLKKCHMIMSGNDCWNRLCFNCCQKANDELANMTLSQNLFQNCVAATWKAQLPAADSLKGGIRRHVTAA